jgi:hypothetical protein
MLENDENIKHLAVNGYSLYPSRNGLFARSLGYAQNFIPGISTIFLR